MAHVQWCIGNTTLREAARLKGGLRILKEHFLVNMPFTLQKEVDGHLMRKEVRYY